MNKLTQHVGISVVFFCRDGAGRVLMAKREQRTRDEQGRWDIGAGRLEFGDTVDWFTLDTLPSPVHSQLPTFLKKYHGRLIP